MSQLLIRSFWVALCFKKPLNIFYPNKAINIYKNATASIFTKMPPRFFLLLFTKMPPHFFAIIYKNATAYGNNKKIIVQRQESYCPTTRKLLSKHTKATVKENYCSKIIKLLSNDKKGTVQRQENYCSTTRKLPSNDKKATV